MGSEPVVFGERIRQAREARGMTKVTLGELIGVSSTTVTNYECGRSEVPSEKISAISTYLRQPLEFFFTPPTEGVSHPESIRFRSLRMAQRKKAPLLTRLSWLEELVSLVDRYVSLPAVNLPEPAFRDASGRLPVEVIEGYASQIREMWGLKPGPIRDLVFAAESNGVLVQHFRFEPEEIDGVSKWMQTLKRPIMILNAARSNMVRTRFSLAHELGHIILHSRLQDSEVVALGHKVIEGEANQFASALLLPREPWMLEARRARTLSAFQALKPRWKVSIKAMLYRSRTLGLVDPERYTQLSKQYSSRRWNHGEPFDNEWIPEEPVLLRESAELLSGPAVRAQILQELLPLDDRDLEVLLGSDALTSDKASLGLELNSTSEAYESAATEQERPLN